MQATSSLADQAHILYMLTSSVIVVLFTPRFELSRDPTFTSLRGRPPLEGLLLLLLLLLLLRRALRLRPGFAFRPGCCSSPLPAATDAARPLLVVREDDDPLLPPPRPPPPPLRPDILGASLLRNSNYGFDVIYGQRLFLDDKRYALCLSPLIISQPAQFASLD
jgi:hypothetical protein